VDYPNVWRVKEAALRRMFAADAATGLDTYIAGRGEALRTFATFCALSRRHAGPWQSWPAALRDPASPAVRAFAEAEAGELRFQSWLQWQCERQLAAAAEAASGMEIGLYRDLAIGAAPDGAEAWASQDLLALGVSVGAPPDPLGPTGQVWNLPPPNPHALAASGYDPFAELLRANMAQAGALRIDHAIGLARLFWVPEGAAGSDGAYVTYPCRDLIGEAALASHEARCMVVGEDLGTVPEGFRETLADAGMLGYRVALLERDGTAFRDPAAYPHLSLACVASHDLPPLKGWWSGHDIGERQEAGQLDGPEGALAGRETEKRALLGAIGAPAEDVIPATHRWLAGGASALVMVQADDLAGETVSVNLPGTDTERPNWRRRLGVDVEELTRSPLLDAVREAR
jgi:glycogen operon protein